MNATAREIVKTINNENKVFVENATIEDQLTITRENQG
jgi:hypothetical protein